jgi:hypothetical protein
MLPNNNDNQRDQIYSDLSLIIEFESEEDFLEFLKKKFKSFRYKISDSFRKDQSFFNDIVEK